MSVELYVKTSPFQLKEYEGPHGGRDGTGGGKLQRQALEWLLPFPDPLSSAELEELKRKYQHNVRV